MTSDERFQELLRSFTDAFQTSYENTAIGSSFTQMPSNGTTYPIINFWRDAETPKKWNTDPRKEIFKK